MKETIKKYKKKLSSSNNIVLENMAGFSSPVKKEMPLDSIHFDGIDEPKRAKYSMDWNDLDYDFDAYWQQQ
jgi:hypothetical protein